MAMSYDHRLIDGREDNDIVLEKSVAFDIQAESSKPWWRISSLSPVSRGGESSLSKPWWGISSLTSRLRRSYVSRSSAARPSAVARVASSVAASPRDGMKTYLSRKHAFRMANHSQVSTQPEGPTPMHARVCTHAYAHTPAHTHHMHNRPGCWIETDPMCH